MARTVDDNKWLAVSELNAGDKVKLTNGEIAEFVRLKQKKFIGIINGSSFDIPVNMYVETVGKAELKQNTEEWKTLKQGELFYINDNKSNALLFIFESFTSGRIVGINPITKAKSRIDVRLYEGKVSDIKEV